MNCWLASVVHHSFQVKYFFNKIYAVYIFFFRCYAEPSSELHDGQEGDGSLVYHQGQVLDLWAKQVCGFFIFVASKFLFQGLQKEMIFAQF